MTTKSTVPRRALLKSTAAVAGAALGSSAITGFPTIWAQNIKDIVLHHAGPPVTAIPAIAAQATKDLDGDPAATPPAPSNISNGNPNDQ